VDADTSRHLGDRSARIEMQANGLVPVFLGEASACRHAISSAGNQRQSRPSVYKIGYGPGLLEGINSLVQAAKARARGYRNKNKMITIIYLTAAKLPLPTLTNPRPAYMP
jgi:hypothetical protein